MSEWTKDSLNTLIQDLNRMESEREEPAQDTHSPDIDAQETLREVDHILGLEQDLLHEFHEYPEDTITRTRSDENVTMGENRYGQGTFESAPHPVEDIFSSSVTDTETKSARKSASKVAIEPDPDMPSFMSPVQIRRKGDDSTDAAAVDDKTKVFDVAGKETSAVPELKPLVPNVPEGMEGQLVLQGYETEEPVEHIDEKQAEKELHERRSHQVRKFKLYDIAQKYEPDIPPSTDILEEKEPGAPKDLQSDSEYDGPEYYQLRDRNQMARRLQDNRRTAFLGAGLMTLAEIVMIVVSVIAGKEGAGNLSVLYAINMVFLSLSVALCLPNVLDGFRSLFRLKPTCNSALSLVSVFALIQAAVAFVLPDSPGLPGTFCAAAGLPLLFCKINNLLESIGVLGNFKLCAYTAADHLYSIHLLTNKKDNQEIGRNLKVGDPRLLYSEKTKFPSDFMRNSDFHTSVDKLCLYMIPGSLLVSAIAALAGWISAKNGLAALTAFTGSLCVSMPAGAALTVIGAVVMVMLHVNGHGGMIVSPEAASKNAHIHAVALDATDLYNGKASNLAYENYHTVRQDELLMYAAAMAFGADSPISGAFKGTFKNTDILPPVKDLIYEERLGLSGYIRGQSVLLGSRNLLINHSIEPPAKSVELKHLHDGKSVLFLAIDNKIAAMFIIKYVPEAKLSGSLQLLSDNDIRALVYAPDSNLSEDFICKSFDLTKGEVVLMNPNAGTLLRDYRANETEHISAELMHNGTPESLLRTVAGAVTIHNIQRIATFAAIIGCGLGWLVCVILMLAKNDISTFNWVLVTVYTLLWTLASSVLSASQFLKLLK